MKPKIEPRLLGKREVAVYLGISLSTVIRWHKSGELPAPIKLGKRILWDRQQLDLMIEAIRDRLSKKPIR